MSPTFALLLSQVPRVARVGKFDMQVKAQTASFSSKKKRIWGLIEKLRERR